MSARYNSIGDPVRADRLNARIGDNDLLETLGGRVAVVGGLNVALEQFADFRQPGQQGIGHFFGHAIAVAGRAILDAALVTQSQTHLFGQVRPNMAQQVADDKANIFAGDIARPAVTGKQ